jgi:murein DD-endopeptidase MepM/ murein hydrolase activator NlpD
MKRSKRKLSNNVNRSSASYEALEPRRLLAANLEIVDAYLIDGDLNQISAPVHGEKIGVRAVWNTTDLPANTSYKIGFYVDGVELQGGTTTAGSGLETGNGYWWYRTGWFADGNVQNVTVVADVLGTVAEADETDNTMSFSFQSIAPTDLPQKLIWPLDGDPYSEAKITNYYDTDPTGDIGDYAGNQSTYNGHNAFDAGPNGFDRMDAGVNIYAAADGVVTYVNDGEYDRNKFWVDGAVANAVRVDHGSGWETFYWHMRKDSVQVEVGQTVTQGELLGLMGSSGISDGLHIHFGLTRHGRSVEPMFDEASYFENPFGNVFDTAYVVDSLVTDFMTSDDSREGGSRILEFDQSSGQSVTAYARFSGIRSSDVVQFSWIRPDGSEYTNATINPSQDYSSPVWWWRKILPNTPDLGTWRIDIKVNGEVLKQEFFDVTADGAPEMRIEDDQGLLIVDDRFTPIDFGAVSLGAASAQQSFSIINHGTAELTLDNIRVPDRFEILATPGSALQAGQSGTLTVGLKTNVAGNHAGEVRISTNDSDEPIYNFSVEGFVSGGGSELVLGVSERRTDEGVSLVANVRRPGNTSGDLTVTLTPGDSSEVSMPSSVTIPSGEDYVSFTIETLADSTVDGPQIVELSAAAPGYATSTNTLEVLDVDADGPSTEAVVFDNGTGQRSIIRSINVDFDIPVTADAGAFELRNSNGDLIDVAFTLADISGSTRATLTFSGTSVDSTGSLEDGNYELKVIGRHIRDYAGNRLGGGLGTDSIDNFFRLFGDTTGDGQVTVFDLLDFRKAYLTSPGDDEFNSAVDFNDDGIISVFDLLAFRQRYNTSV